MRRARPVAATSAVMVSAPWSSPFIPRGWSNEAHVQLAGGQASSILSPRQTVHAGLKGTLAMSEMVAAARGLMSAAISLPTPPNAFARTF